MDIERVIFELEYALTHWTEVTWWDLGLFALPTIHAGEPAPLCDMPVWMAEENRPEPYGYVWTSETKQLIAKALAALKSQRYAMAGEVLEE